MDEDFGLRVVVEAVEVAVVVAEVAEEEAFRDSEEEVEERGRGSVFTLAGFSWVGSITFDRCVFLFTLSIAHKMVRELSNTVSGANYHLEYIVHTKRF